MAVELVPYELIRRVCIASRRADGTAVGFAHTKSTQIIAPETLVRAMMSAERTADGEAPRQPPASTDA